MKVLAALFGITLLGCAPTFHSKEWATLPITERAEILREITQKCGLPSDRLYILQGNEIAVRPQSDDSYESVDCMLGGLKTLRGIQLGFIGNEALIEEKQK